MAVTKAQPFVPLRITSFEGGLNLRDAPTELSLNESPNLMNVVIDERGGVVKRLGYSKWNASAAGNLITYGYYSRVFDLLYWYSPADGKMYSDPGTGVLTLRRTWTTGSNITIVDFAGKTYANHPTDGIYVTTDGTTWAALVAASGSVPKGDLLAVWQNKLWSAGDATSATTKTRLTWCGPGDATKWATADGGGTNDIREGRDADAPIVALFGATGSDYQTKPSLLAFKQTSTHRIVDSTSGAYTTLDAANGAAGPNAVTTAYGRIYTVSQAGIFECDGINPMLPISTKLDPLFAPGAINFTPLSGFAAGAQQGRVFFSISRAGASANDLCLEYHPLFSCFTVRTDAMRCYVPYKKSADVLIGASPTVTGQLYSLNASTGTDDGTAITSWFETKWLEPLGGLRCRVQKEQVRVAGTVQMQLRKDFTQAATSKTLTGPTGSGFIWGTGVWGTAVWGDGASPEGYATDQARAVGKAFQFRFDETSSSTRSGNQLLSGTYQPTVGAWAVYGIDANISQLAVI